MSLYRLNYSSCASYIAGRAGGGLRRQRRRLPHCAEHGGAAGGQGATAAPGRRGIAAGGPTCGALHSSPRAANYYGTAISQCGASESIYDVANLANGAYAYNDEGKTPLWDAGLRVSVFEPSRWCWAPYSSAVNTLYASTLGFTACDDPSEKL